MSVLLERCEKINVVCVMLATSLKANHGNPRSQTGWEPCVTVVLRYFYLFMVSTAPSRPGTPHCRGFKITLRRTTLDRTLDEWSARRRDLYLTTQLSQVAGIHAPGGIRTRSPFKRAAADSRLRSRGHWDRPLLHCSTMMLIWHSLCIFVCFLC